MMIQVGKKVLKGQFNLVTRILFDSPFGNSVEMAMGKKYPRGNVSNPRSEISGGIDMAKGCSAVNPKTTEVGDFFSSSRLWLEGWV